MPSVRSIEFTARAETRSTTTAAAHAIATEISAATRKVPMTKIRCDRCGGREEGMSTKGSDLCCATEFRRLAQGCKDRGQAQLRGHRLHKAGRRWDQSKERRYGKKQRRNQPRIAVAAKDRKTRCRVVDIQPPKLPDHVPAKGPNPE